MIRSELAKPAPSQALVPSTALIPLEGEKRWASQSEGDEHTALAARERVGGQSIKTQTTLMIDYVMAKPAHSQRLLPTAAPFSLEGLQFNMQHLWMTKATSIVGYSALAGFVSKQTL